MPPKQGTELREGACPEAVRGMFTDICGKNIPGPCETALGWARVARVRNGKKLLGPGWGGGTEREPGSSGKGVSQRGLLATAPVVRAGAGERWVRL